MADDPPSPPGPLSHRGERGRTPELRKGVGMLGPVFAAEMVRAGRRGRAHVLRWLFAGWLALQLLYLISHYAGPAAGSSGARAEIAAFARGLIDLLLAQQFILLILVAPAF